MIKEREANSWKSVSYAKSISGAQTYTKFPIVLRTTEQSIPTWSVKGNMAQNGTPTPTSPITPNECGMRTENLWGETSTTNKYIDNQGNTGTNPNGDVYSLKTFTVSPSTTYTFSWSGFTVGNDNNLPYIRICFYTSNGGTFISRTLVNPNDYLDKYVSFTIPNNCTYIDIRIDSEASTRGQHFDNLMLNTGSTAQSYEPYGYKLPIVSGNTTTNIYLSEPLRKINTTYDQLTHTGLLLRGIKKLVLTGQENWSNQNVGQHGAVSIRKDELPLTPDMPAGTLNILSTHFKAISNSAQLNIGEMVAGGSYLNFDYDGTNNLTDFKAYLAQQYANGTPVTVWYVLQTPTTGTTTTSAIPTTSGLNTIDVATTLKPSEMSLTYDGYKLCKGQRYTLLMHDNPLCGIDTYKDTLNLATGACTRQIKKIVFTGEENWVDGNFPLTNTYLYYLTLTDMINVGNVAALDIVCSHFQVGNYYAGQDAPGIQHTLIELYFRTTETTLASFKQWLADQYANGTPVTLYYILATPTTETIAVPTGLSGTEKGYLTQSETPTPTNPVYPTANVVSVWK